MERVVHSRLRTEKFDGNGWNLWKHKFQCAMIAVDLWDVVSEVAPGAEATAAVRDVFAKRDRKAWAEISLHLADSQLPLVMSCGTAKEAWDALCARYEGKSTQNVIFLKRKYRNIRLHDCTSMADFLNRHAEVASQLASVNAVVAEKEQAWELLLGLPDEYLHVGNSYRPDEELKLEDVRQRLIFEEQRQMEREGCDGSSTGSNALYSGHGRGKGFRGRGNSRFNRGNSQFHRGDDAGRGNFSRGCFSCGKFGHYARDCPESLWNPHDANVTEDDS